jgi:hypothetical protein
LARRGTFIRFRTGTTSAAAKRYGKRFDVAAFMDGITLAAIGAS